MSMMASVRSSSYTFMEGSCPSQILQNTHSLISCSLVDGDHPAAWIRRRTVLDAHDGIVQPLRDLTDLAPVDDDALSHVRQLAHRRNDGGGAGAPHFTERALVGGGPDLVDGHGP